MALTNVAREMLLKYRKFLEQDKLGEFYGRIYNEGLDDKDMWSISEFLDESGIKFEEYMDFIPFDFMYTPKDWMNNDTLILPPQIKTIGSNGFYKVEVKAIYADYVEQLGKYILSDSKVKWMRLGDNLKQLSMETFENAQDLVYIAVSKKANKKAIDLLQSFEEKCKQRGPNEIYPNVAVELY